MKKFDPTRKEHLPMIDQAERHCVNFARYALARHERGSALASIDPEEIRALTRNMRREAWQPPQANACMGSITYQKAIMRAYLARWGDMRADELNRFGISWQTAAQFARQWDDVIGTGRARDRYGKMRFFKLERERA